MIVKNKVNLRSVSSFVARYFGVVIYILSGVNFLLFSVFYLNLSKMDSVTLEAKDYIAFSLGIDYVFCISLSLACSYIYYEAPCENKFVNAKKIGAFIDFALPLTLLLLLLRLVLTHWPS